MSNPQSQNSPTQYPLHAALEVALGSLDVQLEEELARYRRQRPHQQVVSTAQSAAIAPNPAEPNHSPPPETATTTGENNDIVNLTQTAAQQTTSPAHEPPQDYLQSSEALLKNLEQSPTSPTSPTPPPTTVTPFKLTWWHMGTALMLGIMATLVGLSIRQTQVTQQPSSGESPTRSSPNVSQSPATTSARSEPSEPLGLDGPNLTESDRDVADTPPAPPSATSTDSASTDSVSPSPVLPGREPDLSSVLLPTNPQASPAEADETPDETDNLAPDPANVAAGPPANDRFYHVTLDYGGASSLAQAQGAVEGVYLRKFPDGIKIQMGAFGSVEDAQSLVNRLKAQGMSAKIYEPQ